MSSWAALDRSHHKYGFTVINNTNHHDQPIRNTIRLKQEVLHPRLAIRLSLSVSHLLIYLKFLKLYKVVTRMIRVSYSYVYAFVRLQALAHLKVRKHAARLRKHVEREIRRGFRKIRHSRKNPTQAPNTTEWWPKSCRANCQSFQTSLLSGSCFKLVETRNSLKCHTT